jgi:cell division protein FtsI (penicillin-binding protein 3)
VKKKILFVFFTFLIFWGAIITKAFYVQVINRAKLNNYANSQFFREVDVYPKRGTIYDREGNALAINVQTYNIYMIPKHKKNIAKNLNKLHKVLPNLNLRQLTKHIQKRKKYTWISRKLKLDENSVEKIQQIQDIYIEPVYTRYYPNQEMMSHLLGYVGNDRNGLAGVEFAFNKELKGVSKKVKYYKDAKGRPVKYQLENEKNEAKDVVLSIDKDIQAAAEQYLKEAIDFHSASGGGVGVMDVATGEIWAMANFPNFDLNHALTTPSQLKKLSFVTDPFEPGSIFKTLTIASALENKIITPDTKFYCEKGKFKVDNHFITEADTDKKHEWLDVKDILKYSSNIGTTKIAFELTYPRFKETIKKFKIGEKTGIEFPAESRGILTKEEKIKKLTFSNMSFGHGLATTPIQMLASYAAIANGGVYVTPTLSKLEIEDEIKAERILTPQISEQLTDMLIEAVETGTGSNAKLNHFKIAGKTSTAQKVQNGRYEGYISGFVGYPVNVSKKFVILAYVDNPRKNGYYGNVVAAPIFQKLTHFVLLKNKEYNHIPSEIANVEHNKELDQVKTVQSSFLKGAFGTIPNFVGLDKRASLELAQSIKLNIVHRGFGIVKHQSIDAGASYGEGATIILQYQAPNNEE